MATFRNIDGEEPGTVTFTVGAVEITRNSSAELQELITLADGDVSTNYARVMPSAPASTMSGLVVRIASGPSSIADLAARIIAPSTYGDGGIFRVAQSTAADLLATVSPASGARFSIQSTAANAQVNPLNSTYGDLTVRAAQSSAGDLNVTVVGTLSSVGGTVLTRAVGDYPHGSTVSTISTNLYGPAIMLRTGSDGLSNTNLYTMLRGSTAAGLHAVPVTDSGVSMVDSTNTALRVNVVAGSAAGSTDVSVTQLRDSSGGSIRAGDSENNALRVNVVAGAAGGSTLQTVRQSTYGDLVVRAAQSTAGDLQMTATPAAGVRFSIQSTAANAAVNALNSTYGDLTVRAAQSTATDLNAAVVQGSTNWSVQVSTGAVSVSTGSVTVHQGSTAFSVQSRITTSSGGSVEGSTQTPPVAGLGLHVRPMPSSVNSTAVVVTSSNSTVLLPVLTSGAIAKRVHAYFVSVSTSANVSTIIFMSGSTNHVWPVVASSGYWAANLAVTPPAELFRANAGEALNVVIQNAATAVTARIGVSWREDT